MQAKKFRYQMFVDWEFKDGEDEMRLHFLEFDWLLSARLLQRLRVIVSDQCQFETVRDAT